MLVVALCIFLFDRYVTRERLCTSPIALKPSTKPQAADDTTSE